MFIVDSQYVICKLLGQIIRLRAQFPDYTIKNIHLDNAGEFISQALMIIACPLELILNIQLRMFTHKMDSLNL